MAKKISRFRCLPDLVPSTVDGPAMENEIAKKQEELKRSLEEAEVKLQRARAERAARELVIHLAAATAMVSASVDELFDETMGFADDPEMARTFTKNAEEAINALRFAVVSKVDPFPESPNGALMIDVVRGFVEKYGFTQPLPDFGVLVGVAADTFSAVLMGDNEELTRLLGIRGSSR